MQSSHGGDPHNRDIRFVVFQTAQALARQL